MCGYIHYAVIHCFWIHKLCSDIYIVLGCRHFLLIHTLRGDTYIVFEYIYCVWIYTLCSDTYIVQ